MTDVVLQALEDSLKATLLAKEAALKARSTRLKRLSLATSFGTVLERGSSEAAEAETQAQLSRLLGGV